MPGTPRQLGTCGLFPPSSAQRRPLAAAGHVFDTKTCVPGLLWLGFGELCVRDVAPGAFEVLAAEHNVWVVDDVPPPGHAATGVNPAVAWQRFADLMTELARKDATLFVVARVVPEWLEAAEGAADPAVRSALILIGRTLAGLPLMKSDERLAVEGISGS